MAKAAFSRAVIIGASGGIGGALADALEGRGTEVVRLSRSAQDKSHRIDICDEASIRQAALNAGQGGPIDLVIVATGLLHGAGLPEKSLRDISAATLEKNFQMNAIGPVLVAKHFLPLIPRNGRSLFAALSARVGSISDNRLGGWYGYRASKAALNMFIRNLAIEYKRNRPDLICAALHPGTVDTDLSKPFQANVPAEKLFTPHYSADCLLRVMESLSPEQSGRIFAWDGQEIAP